MLHSLGTPLTANGQVYALPHTGQEMMCLTPDARLLISDAKKNHPDVISFIARLSRLNISHTVHYVSYDLVRAAYRAPSTVPADTSEMQAFATRLFRAASAARASDIHIRVNKTNTTILLTVHNKLKPHETHPVAFGKLLLGAIYTAMCDVSAPTYQPLVPQEARISDRSKLPADLDGIRVGTLPQVSGEIMVLRLLYENAQGAPTLAALGFSQQHVATLSAGSRKPYGINLVCGPTGSGKSTSLHRLLSDILVGSNYQKNVITIEDPPEYTIPGAVQTPVANASTTDARRDAYALSINATLRCAPHVIMIGEVRDNPSAMLAFRAAMTGHQVWTTLHSTSIFSAFARLHELGVSPDLLFDAEVVSTITSQRLLNVLCPHCKLPIDTAKRAFLGVDVDRVTLATAAASSIRSHAAKLFVTGDGCSKCHDGIAGRRVVAETLHTNEEIMNQMRENGRPAGFKYWRTLMGGLTLMDHTLATVAQGIADPFDAETVVGLFAAQ
jgi:general secretion pathway protein E